MTDDMRTFRIEIENPARPGGSTRRRKPARRERSYITNGISCLSFVMYFSKKCFWMSFISSSRPWM